MGEICHYLKGILLKYTEELFAMFMAAIDDSSKEVNSSAIYGLGCLLEGTNQDLSR